MLNFPALFPLLHEAALNKANTDFSLGEILPGLSNQAGYLYPCRKHHKAAFCTLSFHLANKKNSYLPIRTIWPSVRGLILTAGLTRASFTHVAAPQRAQGQSRSLDMRGSSRTAQHRPILPAWRRSAQGPAFWESHRKCPGLRILTECHGMSKQREELLYNFSGIWRCCHPQGASARPTGTGC